MGKTYFITGVNRGIGFEIVKKYLEADSSNIVIGTARNPSKATELLELESKYKGQLHIIQLDVSDLKSIDSIDSQIKEVAKDGIDVYISNAAYSAPGAAKKVLELERQIWIDHYIVNVLGPFEVLRVIKPYLLKKETKHVVIISSLAGSLSQNFPISTGPYGQNKAALNHVAITLSHELSPEGITVVAAHPGLVDTESGREVLKEYVEYKPELSALLNNLPFDKITQEESAKGLIDTVIDPLTKEQNGKFLNYDGAELQW
ncbi:3-oxoacyl-[acyl-carrier-protein] reductase [Wickerhamomyces ciferrii]|uniref:3-oxoacyl-[acyl-carrier-protein] reductase n=1 Tax=Wickerhamomyces ciferrii (strain ATCC 14091 / BCRC 22168 / CBS 111 / JCM 3599 / NBRC 0793 / NRRL Y-1031 F-60-10) TaxID=1206466 RepID=K0KK09_WICCF|nr:3-oxoacyl-[acyl-carrier-protein] reductase [Wickerhamomyces ciferrii]CCH41784.1 3-oxoacyl-[acyl-carrier-protein] reductase [Wickerhamomyces ciferrii]